MNQVAILCGGQGTRLGASKTPKPLRHVADRPFLEHKFRSLARAGITDAVLLCGPHLHSFLEATSRRFNSYDINIEYWADESLGTGGAVAQALPALAPAFWITYGDSLTMLPPLPEADAVLGGSMADLTVIRHHRPNVRVDGTVVSLYADGHIQMGTHLDYGMTACRTEVFAHRSGNFSIQQALFHYVRAGEVRATEVRAPLYHLNTAQDLAATEEYLDSVVR